MLHYFHLLIIFFLLFFLVHISYIEKEFITPYIILFSFKGRIEGYMVFQNLIFNFFCKGSTCFLQYCVFNIFAENFFPRFPNICISKFWGQLFILGKIIFCFLLWQGERSICIRDPFFVFDFCYNFNFSSNFAFLFSFWLWICV